MAKRPRVVYLPVKAYKKLLALTTWSETVPEEVHLDDHAEDQLSEAMSELWGAHHVGAPLSETFIRRGVLMADLYVDLDTSTHEGYELVKVLPRTRSKK